MALTVQINGKTQSFAGLEAGAGLVQLVGELGLQMDRVAVERNGDIVPRRDWPQEVVEEGDRLEIVHFVGGG